ncbi:hypothetical protein GWP43_09350 [Treponema vincentii]|uniref:NrS-1 polymerase-like helicase domain-containing protein n=1 Tax=Treponema vincentii TaxID=69710 RepID=A0A6P1Y1F2_9SPIR|nr:primase-helicase family protein [Treponema vincentii]QHX43607.1 hypothetical protein GWP43_09350 [Treponema vincentii]
MKIDLSEFLKLGGGFYIPQAEFTDSIKGATNQMAQELAKKDELTLETLHKQMRLFIEENNTTLWGNRLLEKEFETKQEDGTIIKGIKKVPAGKTGQDLYEVHKEEIESHIAALVIDNTTHKIPYKRSVRTFIEAMKYLSPNWEAASLATSYTAIRKLFENIYNELGYEGARKQDVCVIFEQLKRGGGGKSVFLKGLASVLKKYGLQSTDDDLPRQRFNSPQAANNHLVIHNDIGRTEWRNRAVGIFNNQIDRNEYIYEPKGKATIALRARATHIISTNVHLEDEDNNRRYAYIPLTNRVLFATDGAISDKNVIPQEDLKKYFSCYPYSGNEDAFTERLEYWIEKAFLSCPFGYTFSLGDVVKSKTPKLPRKFFLLIHELENFVEFEGKEYLGNLKLGQFIRETAFNERKPEENDRYFRDLKDTLNTYFGEKIRTGGKPFRTWSFAWNKILEIGLAENESPDAFEDIEDIQEKWLKAHRAIINAAIEDIEPLEETLTNETAETKDVRYNRQPVDANLTEEEKEVQEFIDAFHLHVCKDKYTKPETALQHGTNYEFMVNGSCTADDRKAEHVIPKMFVYEIDYLEDEGQETDLGKQLKKQWDIIKKSIDTTNHIASVTLSGNKSIHVLVPHTDGELIKEDYKFYWEETAKRLFGEDSRFFDTACASVGRLTRCFNMKRGNIEQKLLYKNLKATPIDVKPLMEARQKEKAQKVILANLKVYAHNGQTDYRKKLENCARKYPVNENYQKALDIINGSVDKGLNPVAIIQSLKSSDFNESWVKSYIYEPMNREHPSCTGQAFEYYWR